MKKINKNNKKSRKQNNHANSNKSIKTVQSKLSDKSNEYEDLAKNQSNISEMKINQKQYTRKGSFNKVNSKAYDFSSKPMKAYIIPESPHNTSQFLASHLSNKNNDDDIKHNTDLIIAGSMIDFIEDYDNP
jgi:hypothetical protein